MSRRTDAIRAGAKTYSAAAPCRNGHFLRYASCGRCVQCAADDQRAKTRAAQEARVGTTVRVSALVPDHALADVETYVASIGGDMRRKRLHAAGVGLYSWRIPAGRRAEFLPTVDAIVNIR